MFTAFILTTLSIIIFVPERSILKGMGVHLSHLPLSNSSGNLKRFYCFDSGGILINFQKGLAIDLQCYRLVSFICLGESIYLLYHWYCIWISCWPLLQNHKVTMKRAETKKSGFVSNRYDDDSSFLVGTERCCGTYQAGIITAILLLECMHLGFGKSPFDPLHPDPF